MIRIRADQFPSILLILLTILAFVVFWSIMDMVLLGASLAIVLIPLHHRLSRHMRPWISASVMTLAVLGVFCAMGLITLAIFSANSATLTQMFTTIGNWLNNPLTNPMAYGVPLSKTTSFRSFTGGNSTLCRLPENPDHLSPRHPVQDVCLLLYPVHAVFTG